MGKTKPVWLVALQSAAKGGMGNRMLTREEFEAAMKRIDEEVQESIRLQLKRKALPRKRKAKVKS